MTKELNLNFEARKLVYILAPTRNLRVLLNPPTIDHRPADVPSTFHLPTDPPTGRHQAEDQN